MVAWILLRAAGRGFLGSGVAAVISVLTIAVALFLVGAFALVVVNMEGLLDGFGRDLSVTAYLQSDLSSQDMQTLAEAVRSVEVVEELTVVNPQQALERFRRLTGGAALLEAVEGNPLPASFEVWLRPEYRSPEGLAILESAIEGLAGIDELRHGREWIEGYARVVSLVRVSGYAVGVVLSLATLLIVANTIRLGMYGRRGELEILELVGASRTFVRTPFLLEGTWQGVLGGLLAACLLWLCFLLLLPQLQYGLAFLLGQAEARFFGFAGVSRLVMTGALLGLVGAAAALLGRKS